MKQFWNERYNTADYVYGTEANDFFRDKLEGMTPGKLLLPAEGEGRNAVYAARKGWEVSAFDHSIVAMEKAEKLASRYNLKMDYRCSSWLEYTGRNNYFDAIGLFFFHLPEAQRKLFHSLLIDWLKPGGYLIAEVFSQKQLEMDSGGPGSPDLLYTVKDLQKDFAGMEIEILEEVKRELKEGTFHTGDAWVIRLMAKKS